jgi:hypothetical protein
MVKQVFITFDNTVFDTNKEASEYEDAAFDQWYTDLLAGELTTVSLKDVCRWYAAQEDDERQEVYDTDEGLLRSLIRSYWDSLGE